MDCVHAQQVLSEVFDGAPVPEAMRAEAQAHSAACSECSAFEHGLALLAEAGAPDVPTGLHDRIMRAVEAERSASLEATPMASADAVQRVEVVTAGRRRRSPWALGAWIGGAAAVLLVAVFVAVSGVRSIVSPTPSANRGTLAGGQESVSTADKSATSAQFGEQGAAAPQASATQPGQTAATPPDYITLNGVLVYAAVGEVDLDPSASQAIGTTVSSLSTSGAPDARSVYATADGASRVAIVADGTAFAFERVTREFDGRTYVLTSEPITSFGVWPTLPSDITEPTSADGRPSFIPTEKDTSGIQLYVRPDVPIEGGFAIAPGTPAADPAAGNPNWTWWTAERR